MNKKMVMILGLGLVVTMVMAVVVQALLSPKKDAQMAQKKTEILVATRNLSVGDELSDTVVNWQEWPKDSVFIGAILREGVQKPTEAVSGMLIRDLQQGEPVMRSALAENHRGNILAASLRDGMRAMGIRVSAESMVGGFLTAGDYVDVIMTYQVRVPATDEVRDAATNLVSRNASQTVLENVKILAVDQDAKAKDDAKIARTVTLEVDAKGTETLALASSMGELSLVLRKLGDTSKSDKSNEALTTDVLVSDVLRQLTSGQGSQESRTIRVYNGPNIQEQVVRARIMPMLP